MEKKVDQIKNSQRKMYALPWSSYSIIVEIFNVIDFNLENDQGSIKRGVCECDKNLGESLLELELNPRNIDLDRENCVFYMQRNSQGKCCLLKTGLYSWHPSWYSCESTYLIQETAGREVPDGLKFIDFGGLDLFGR
jgi:hypothetical protein